MRTSPIRRFVPLVLSLLMIAAGLGACHEKPAPAPASSASTAPAAPSEKQLRESLAGLQPQLDALSATFATLGKQVEAIPPDLPGFGEVRAKFYATDEGMGIMGPKLSWLSARLDSALKSKKPEELAQVSQDIERTYGELRQIDRISLELLHQLLHFQKQTEQGGDVAANALQSTK